jgi:hypothetical protein
MMNKRTASLLILLLLCACQRKPVVDLVSGTGSGSKTPRISSVSPSTLPVGGSATISGSNLGSTQGELLIGTNTVTTVSSWTDDTITFTMPPYADTSLTVRSVNGVAGLTGFKVSETVTLTAVYQYAGTSMKLKLGQHYTVTAAGTMNYSLGGGTSYTTGPDGDPASGYGRLYAGMGPTTYSYLCGSSFSGTASLDTAIWFMAIGPTSPPGTLNYTITVTVE